MPPLRTALVTGASSGLGRELTRLLALERGITVLATARRLDRLEALRESLPPGQVEILAGDIGDPQFRAELWQRAEAMPGGLDLLVNNAGIGHYADFGDEDPAQVEQILNVNVNALFDLTQKAIRHMRGRGQGQILEISSVLGEFGIPYSATYVASKHAVNGLVKCLGHELRGSGVRIWAALPGRFASEFRQKALGDQSAPTKSLGSEPTEKVARGINRGIDGNRRFLAPTWRAWATLVASRWLPAPFDWFVGSFGNKHFAREMGQGRGE